MRARRFQSVPWMGDGVAVAELEYLGGVGMAAAVRAMLAPALPDQEWNTARRARIDQALGRCGPAVRR